MIELAFKCVLVAFAGALFVLAAYGIVDTISWAVWHG